MPGKIVNETLSLDLEPRVERWPAPHVLLTVRGTTGEMVIAMAPAEASRLGARLQELATSLEAGVDWP